MTSSVTVGERNALTRVIRVREFDSVEVSPDEVLTDGRLTIYDWLEGKGYFSLTVGTRATRLYARGHVGLIPINDHLTLEVVPRVPLGSLSRLLEVSRVAPKAIMNVVRMYDREGTMYPSIAVLYAAALRDRIEAIASQGLLKEYERRHELTSFPRGRIDVRRTMSQAARGNTHHVAVSYFQRSVDNPSNRCLLFAVWRLAQYIDRVASSLPERQVRRARRDLTYSMHQLQGVHLDLNEEFLRDGVVTGMSPLPTLRAYYRGALDLALAIIGRQAVLLERRGSEFRLPSLVVDMSAVFEAYARETLARASEVEAWTERVLNGNKWPPIGGSKRLFDDGLPIRATPDIVIEARPRPGEIHRLLIEVKYKPASDQPDRNDLNQAITYGASYKAGRVVLLQPKADGSLRNGLEVLGRIGGLLVYRYVLDLGAADLSEDEGKFATTMRELASGVHALSTA